MNLVNNSEFSITLKYILKFYDENFSILMVYLLILVATSVTAFVLWSCLYTSLFKKTKGPIGIQDNSVIIKLLSYFFSRTFDGNTTRATLHDKEILRLLESRETRESIAIIIEDWIKGNNSLTNESFFLHLLAKFPTLSSYTKNKISAISDIPIPNGVDTHDREPKDIEKKHLEYMPPHELDEYLKGIHSWGFDVLKLKTRVQYPLVVVTLAVLKEMNVIEILNLNEKKLKNFLVAVHNGYLDNPYHNSLHAADVTQSTFYLLHSGNLIKTFTLDHLSSTAILIAAAVHDIGHPGVTGRFLNATISSLSLEYNDKSPLENMHVSLAFKLWLRDENNFSAGLPTATFRELRRLVIETVLSTDAEIHNSLMGRLALYHKEHDGGQRVCFPDKLMSSPTKHDLIPSSCEEVLILQLTLHLADVSNPAKPWEQYTKWLDLLMQEFYAQGDAEKERGLGVSYAFDRAAPVKDWKFQLGFINMIVEPLMTNFAGLEGLDLTPCLEQLKVNTANWKYFELNNGQTSKEISRTNSYTSPLGLNHRCISNNYKKLSLSSSQSSSVSSIE